MRGRGISLQLLLLPGVSDDVCGWCVVGRVPFPGVAAAASAALCAAMEKARPPAEGVSTRVPLPLVGEGYPVAGRLSWRMRVPAWLGGSSSSRGGACLGCAILRGAVSLPEVPVLPV